MYQRPKEDDIQQTADCIAARTETALVCMRSENRKGYTSPKNYRGKLKKKKMRQLLILMFSWTLLRSDSPFNLSGYFLCLKISQFPGFLWDLSSPVFFSKHIWTEGWVGLGKENPSWSEQTLNPYEKSRTGRPKVWGVVCSEENGHGTKSSQVKNRKNREDPGEQKMRSR